MAWGSFPCKALSGPSDPLFVGGKKGVLVFQPGHQPIGGKCSPYKEAFVSYFGEYLKMSTFFVLLQETNMRRNEPKSQRARNLILGGFAWGKNLCSGWTNPAHVKNREA